MTVRMREFTLVTFIKYLPALLVGLRGAGAAEFIDLTNEKSVALRMGRGPLAALPMTYAGRASLVQDAAPAHGDIENINRNFLYTRQTAFMKGWAPETELKTFERIVTRTCGFYLLEYADAEYGQRDVPVKFKNNAFFSAFEGVAAIGDAPVYGQRDPAPALALLFFIFFGIIAGDAGYGLLLLVSSALALKNRALKAARYFLRPLHFLGYSAVVFGTLYGKFFGRVFFAPLLKPDGFIPVLAAKPGVTYTLALAAAFGALHAVAVYAAKRPARIRDGPPRRISVIIRARLLKFMSLPRRLKRRGRIPFSPASVYGAAWSAAAEKTAGHMFSYALFAAFVLTGGHIAAALGRAALDAGAGPALSTALAVFGGFIDMGFICAGLFLRTRGARFNSRYGGEDGGKIFTPF